MLRNCSLILCVAHFRGPPTLRRSASNRFSNLKPITSVIIVGGPAKNQYFLIQIFLLIDVFILRKLYFPMRWFVWVHYDIIVWFNRMAVRWHHPYHFTDSKVLAYAPFFPQTKVHYLTIRMCGSIFMFASAIYVVSKCVCMTCVGVTVVVLLLSFDTTISSHDANMKYILASLSYSSVNYSIKAYSPSCVYLCISNCPLINQQI